jgi:Lipocalin-like domain
MASPNTAQSQGVPSLLGTWRLVSYEARDSKGRVQYPLGENVSGLLIYDGSGNMSAHVMRNNIPLFAANDPTRGTDGFSAFSVSARACSVERSRVVVMMVVVMMTCRPQLLR